MLYESIHHSFGVSTDHGCIQFKPNGELVKNNEKQDVALGEVDTADEGLQATLQLSDADMQKLIEDMPDYKRNKPGKLGVWRKSDRMSQQESETMALRTADSMKILDEDTLRSYIAKQGGDVPVEATKDALVELATALALSKQGIKSKSAKAEKVSVEPAPTSKVQKTSKKSTTKE